MVGLQICEGILKSPFDGFLERINNPEKASASIENQSGIRDVCGVMREKPYRWKPPGDI